MNTNEYAKNVSVTHAYTISAGGSATVVFGEQVMQEIRHEIYEVLKRHADELIEYDWTLNKTYEEDGEQVVIRYPYSFGLGGVDEMLPKILTSDRIIIHEGLFTTEQDRDKVAEFCKAVAIGEIEPKGVMQ